ncbi:bifunctional DNA primase/polymerase [Nonomuraea cavernae]|uniref:bifunctional DNA primase/polymerase n=1 Tax=Nonomuraea cavernae TaxID=2045107 RepID=UPI0016657F82|nr:bifunctional DNA primase/polymerase [Nonomuraea cavernae]MCA2186197.1 bifunctional DNA primase/polymerase [Nonomuraea cavernae]
MVGVPLARRTRKRSRPTRIDSVLGYAALGWPVVPGAHPLRHGSRACSCDRLGCPDPGAHPVSPAWHVQATTDPTQLTRWWQREPEANVILPTGRVFDVFDVPLPTGLAALTRIDADEAHSGPVAANGDRVLFYVATRGNPEDEDEWWSCQLDCDPATIDDTPGLRWHCRDSYVLAPPSTLPTGQPVSWLRPPDGRPLPDPLRILDVLAD